MTNTWLIALFFIGTSQCFSESELFDFFYLTFEEEETWSSLTVNFQTTGQLPPGSGKVYYDTESRHGQLNRYAFHEVSRVDLTRDTTKKRSVHHVKLNQLKPGTAYYFIAGSDETGYSKEMKFKTLPNDSTPLRLLVGGDMGTSLQVEETSRHATNTEHDIILLGGDLAYAAIAGPYSPLGKWDRWLSLLQKITTSPSGFLIPLIIAIGNHEVSTGLLTSTYPHPTHFNFINAPHFFEFFPQQAQPTTGRKKTFFTKTLGNHTVLFVLDSGHYHPHENQVNWLRRQLSQHQNLPNKIALYHVPLYPNSRSENNPYTKKGREYWKPLFDEHNLTLAFEHHEHTLKRTFPIKHGTTKKLAESTYSKGTVYIGNGCWGRSPREHNPNKWYLAKSSSDHHVWSIEVSSKQINLIASGANKQIFDHFSLINPPNNTTVIKEHPLSLK